MPLLPGGAERVEGARARRVEVREENVPVLCAFEGVGVGVGDGPERRVHWLWYNEGVCEDVRAGKLRVGMT